jgi:hypothetical protein
LLVDYELSGGEQDTRALAFVGCVQVYFACAQVEGLGLRVRPSFGEFNLPISDKFKLPSGWSWNQPYEADVIAESSGKRDVTHGPHLGQRVDETLILTVCKCLHQHLSFLQSRVVVNGQSYFNVLSELRACTHGSSFDRFGLLRENRRTQYRQRGDQQETANGKFANGCNRLSCVSHLIVLRRLGR